jgi:hypothetical protein
MSMNPNIFTVSYDYKKMKLGMAKLGLADELKTRVFGKKTLKAI